MKIDFEKFKGFREKILWWYILVNYENMADINEKLPNKFKNSSVDDANKLNL